jgi:NADH-quinone oxidoreductase subunit N
VASLAWELVVPEIIVLSASILLILVDSLLRSKGKWVLGYLILAAFVIALLYTVGLWGINVVSFSKMFTVDVLAIVMKAILLVAAIIVVIATLKTNHFISPGEFYSLISLSVFGAMVMASASDLILLFIALELTVVPCYVLAGIKRADVRSTEVALKYFLIGLLASAVMLYGMSLIFGLTGSTSFNDIADALKTERISPLLIIAILMIATGLGFKIAAVPFHFWLPDVYEGSPVACASFFAVGPKAGGFAAILRFFPVALAAVEPGWVGIFAILAVISMTIGNTVALTQTHIRRLLGYSSIAHTGYLLIGLVVATSFAKNALVFYFIVYAAATLGAFLVVLAVTERGLGEALTNFAGLSRRSPYLAAAMAIFLFSLVGLPPLAGFMGKLYLFGSAVQAEMIWLALVGVLNSVVSLGYYAAVIKQMYLTQPNDPKQVPVSFPIGLSIFILLTIILLAGLYPTAFLSIIKV